MNIIVTNNKIEYSGFLKVLTLRQANESIGTIDFLVYHKSNESRDEKVEFLTKLKDKVNTMIYIRDKSQLDQAVQMIVVGSGGKYLDDEFFLESSEELNKLVKSLDEVTEIAELGGVNVLSDFFNRYLKNGSSGFNSSYLAVVKDAVHNLMEDYRQKDLQLLQLSETATEIFANSVDLISKQMGEQSKLKEAIATLETSREDNLLLSKQSLKSMHSVLFFPQVSYMKEKGIFRIKDIGRCTYLTSFVMSYRVYLEKIKNVRPKLIIIEPVGEVYEKVYKDYSWVTQRTSRTMSNYYSNVVFTNYPTKEVLYRLLDDNDYDTFIIVDRLISDSNHILNSKGPSPIYAINGSSMLDKFNLKGKLFFTSLREVDSNLFTIPLYTEYPKDPSQRERLYLRSLQDSFERLYSLRRK